jgi:hypothetical protein
MNAGIFGASTIFLTAQTRNGPEIVGWTRTELLPTLTHVSNQILFGEVILVAMKKQRFYYYLSCDSVHDERKSST